MPDNELKPCEYGSTLLDVEESFDYSYRVYCVRCGAVSSWQDNPQEAIEAWNKRS